MADNINNLIGDYQVKPSAWPLGAGLQMHGWVVVNGAGVVVYRCKQKIDADRFADQQAVSSRDG